MKPKQKRPTKKSARPARLGELAPPPSLGSRIGVWAALIFAATLLLVYVTGGGSALGFYVLTVLGWVGQFVVDYFLTFVLVGLAWLLRPLVARRKVKVALRGERRLKGYTARNMRRDGELCRWVEGTGARAVHASAPASQVRKSGLVGGWFLLGLYERIEIGPNTVQYENRHMDVTKSNVIRGALVMATERAAMAEEALIRRGTDE